MLMDVEIKTYSLAPSTAAINSSLESCVPNTNENGGG